MDAHQDGLKKTEPVSGAAIASPYSADTANGWNRFLGRLLDQTSQPFVVTDFAGRLVHVNQAFQKLVGRTAEELKQITYNELTPERWRGVSEPYLADFCAHGQGADDSRRPTACPTAERCRSRWPLTCTATSRASPTGYYAFITDIGERKHTEAALRASEERFRLLYDEAPFGYHEIDADGRILMVNRTECEMLGYTREEMLGRPIYDFLVEGQRDVARHAVRERFKGGRPVMSVERCYRTKDGRELILAIENRLTRDAAGKVVSIRSTTQDITWRKQAEAALIASERRARALFEGIEDAIFVHDLEGHILDANPSACRRLGYTREELLHLKTSDIDEPGLRHRLRGPPPAPAPGRALADRGPAPHQGRPRHAGRYQHLDHPARGPDRGAGRDSRYHRAKGARGNAQAIRRGTAQECVGDRGQEPAAAAVGGAVPAAH